MRRWLAISIVIVLAAVAAGCGGGGGGTTTDNHGSTSADKCAKDQLKLVTPGTLTIGTGNPAYPPWYEGGTIQGSPFKVNDPSTGEGYESAVAYAIAKRLGFAKPDVKWTAVPFNLTFRPGPKNFDFAMQQISYSRKRAEAVDFSKSYYDVNQALVALKDKPTANATSLSDLKNANLGAVVGTTSY